MVEHGAVEEDVMHIMHDSPLGESQMGFHNEPVLDLQLTLGSAMEEEMLEMVVHPYLGQPIDEVSVDAYTVSRTAVLSRSNTFQEYIYGACSTYCPLEPIIERGAFPLRQFLLTGGTEQHELSVSWQPHSRHVPYANITTLDSSIE